MSSFVKDFEDFCQDSEEAQETMRKLRKIIKEQKSKKIQEKKAEEVQTKFINPKQHIRKALAKAYAKKKYVTIGGKK